MRVVQHVTTPTVPTLATSPMTPRLSNIRQLVTMGVAIVSGPRPGMVAGHSRVGTHSFEVYADKLASFASKQHFNNTTMMAIKTVD